MIITNIVDCEVITSYNWGVKLRLFFEKSWKKSNSYVYNLSLKQYRNLKKSLRESMLKECSALAVIDNDNERFVWSGIECEKERSRK